MMPPTKLKLKELVFSMDPDSAPSPDGFSGIFFHKWCYLTENEIHGSVVEFFRGGSVPQGFTCMNLALIPKKINPSSFDDVRPISVCNLFYKIFSRAVLLRHVMRHAQVCCKGTSRIYQRLNYRQYCSYH